MSSYKDVDGNIHIGVPPAAQYGRQPGGAEAARDEWWGMRGAGQERQQQAIGASDWMRQQGQTGGNQAQENAALASNYASGAGGNQQGAIQLARQMAMGQSPSAAAYQLQSGLDQSSRMQSAMAGGARGGAALATAGQNAQANTSNLQQNAFTQGQMLRAREMAQGAGMYSTLLGQQREQATARLGMGNEMSQFNAGQRDRYNLGMQGAAIGMGQAANQQGELDLGYYQQGMNPINAQTQAQQQYQQWLDSARRQAYAANQEEGG